jgi:hypothetical protein
MIFRKKGDLAIDQGTLERLARVAHRQGRSVPALVQAALLRYLEEAEAAEPRPLPWIDGGGCVVDLNPEALRTPDAG